MLTDKKRLVKLPDGTYVPAIGQGTWYMGENFKDKEREIRALRLGTNHLDLYILHWKGGVSIEETIEGMEKLRKEGKILRWGVSNLDTDDMEELFGCRNGTNCTTNQVLYHLGSRGIEL